RKALERTLNFDKMWRTAPLIWHEPLMAVGPNRYAGALLSHVGFDVIDFDSNGNGYPEVTPTLMAANDVELLLLTSEPHEFTADEGESLIELMKHEKITSHYRLIDGEDLTWFGSRTAAALENFSQLFQTLEISNQTGR
ncbi:MAG: helical backbone metal receptor, partial [Candidatus Poseidoniaceae archaeon]